MLPGQPTKSINLFFLLLGLEKKKILNSFLYPNKQKSYSIILSNCSTGTAGTLRKEIPVNLFKATEVLITSSTEGKLKMKSKPSSPRRVY